MIVSYMLIMVSFFSMTSMLMTFLMLEMNVLLFLMLYYYNNSSMNLNMFNSMDSSFYYFLIQNLFSIFFLFIMMMNPWLEMNNIISLNLMVFVMAMKMGIYPFSSWIFKMVSKSNNNNLFILIILQKLPMFSLFELMEYNISMYLMLMNMMMGCLFMINSNSIKYLILSSSIYSMIWLYMMFNMSLQVFMIYYFIYSLITFMILNMNKVNLNKIHSKMLMLMMFSLNNPPMGSFFLKFIFIMDIIFISMTNKMIMIMGMTFSLFAYMKFLLIFFYKNMSFYMNNLSMKLFKINIILMSFLFFL